MRRNGTVFAVAVAACAQQDHRGQGQPAAHGVHHHRACKVVKLSAGVGQQPGLDAPLLVPSHTFIQGVDHAHQNRSSDQLWPKLGALGNAAGDDGGNGGRKGQ